MIRCKHAMNESRSKISCEHFGKWVTEDTCSGCPFFSEGTHYTLLSMPTGNAPTQSKHSHTDAEISFLIGQVLGCPTGLEKPSMNSRPKTLPSKTAKALIDSVKTAPEYPDPFTEGPVTHLGVHLWPVAPIQGMQHPWMWHINNWNEVAEQVNGRCLIGVVQDKHSVDISVVKALLHPKFEVFAVPQDGEGENHTFRRLLQELPHGNDDILLYCHGKGVRHYSKRNPRQAPAVKLWTELLYETVVFNRDRIEEKLAEGYKAFGSFRCFSDDSKVLKNQWYYSGTFLAVRLKHVHDKKVKKIYGGVEHFLGDHFPAKDCWVEAFDECGVAAEYNMTNLYPKRVFEGFKWEMSRFSGPPCEQHKRELDWFLPKLDPTDHILVIGSRGGGLEYQMKLKHQSITTVSVDLERLPTQENELIVGDSHSLDIQDQIRNKGPYSVVFIDGDHTYAGVKQDWEFALTLNPRMIALHDIGDGILHKHRNCHVDKLWSEITKSYRTEEKIVGCGWGGIGVVYP